PRPSGAPPECQKCGYCLKGLEQLEQPRCPECGEPIPAGWLTSQLSVLRPSWALKTLSLMQTLCTAFAAIAWMTGFFFADNGKFHPEWRKLVAPWALTSGGFALAGIALGVGMFVFFPIAHRYRSPHLNLRICLVIFILGGCCSFGLLGLGYT